MKFSVLLSIYYKENPSYFHQAMESLWDNQTLRPAEVILVEDGKLTDELYKVIDGWEIKMKGVLQRVKLSENQGLGKALNIGLQHCKYQYVARMDTDDICTSDRFEKQIEFLLKNSKIDILGGQIEEFEKEIGDIKSYRSLPTSHGELMRFAKKRNPFNHPTIIYRKLAVLEAGGYQDDYLYEDYALWVRMICDGVRVANLSDVVLFMRAGTDMFRRRGGLKYAISELKIQYKFYRLGFLSLLEFFRNIITRFPVRIMPNQFRVYIYKKLLRNSRLYDY